VGLIGRTALESGFLTGKYRKGCRFPDGDHRARWNGAGLDVLLEEVRRMQDWCIASPCRDLAQVALRYALDEPDLSTVIVGAKNAAQSRANLEAAALPALPPALRNRLARRYHAAANLVNLPG
jgi:aryl-alcohol dehydrogenase-like predicted oxidoreductase